MKKTELNTLRAKEEKEIIKMVSGKKLELAKNAKNPKSIRIEIAQMLTVLKEKEIAKNENMAAKPEEIEK